MSPPQDADPTLRDVLVASRRAFNDPRLNELVDWGGFVLPLTVPLARIHTDGVRSGSARELMRVHAHACVRSQDGGQVMSVPKGCVALCWAAPTLLRLLLLSLAAGTRSKTSFSCFLGKVVPS